MDHAYNHLHGLSQLGAPSRTPPPVRDLTDQKKQFWLNAVNYLATVLVFHPGEKAATTILLQDGVHIFWAKDVVVDAEDIAYAESLLHCSQATYEALLTEVIIPKCWPSIQDHLQNLVDNFQPIDSPNLFNWNNDDLRHRKLRDSFIARRIAAAQYADDFRPWLDCMIRVAATVNRTDDSLVSLLTATFLMCLQFGGRGPWGHLVSSGQCDAIQRLGRYCGAAHRLFRAQKAYRAKGVKFTVRYIPAPEPRWVDVHSTTMEALHDGLDKARSGDAVALDLIRRTYPEASLGIFPNRMVAIRCTQHPKVTVTLPLICAGVKTAYIGASDRSCCVWCDTWVSSTIPDAYTYPTHRIYPIGWMIPDNAPEGAVRNFQENLRQRVLRILDSWPFNGKQSWIWGIDELSDVTRSPIRFVDGDLVLER